MPRFLTRLNISAVLFLFVFGLGIPIPTMGSPQETVKPSDPELINLYYAELGRSYCDHLTIAVLQGSKEGVVVSLFPPGNTGTKNMPKEGQIVNLFPPGNTGTRTDTGGGQDGELSGMNKAELVDAIANDAGNPMKKADPVALVGFGIFSNTARNGRNPQTGVPIRNVVETTTMAKSDAQDHNTTQSNRTWMATDSVGNSGKSDVKQCEHCGATCTEPCRCNPTGIELIFGKNDDQAGMMQASADFTYLTFQTSYGMRSVTLISMGADSKLTLVIAKGWGRTSGDCNDSVTNINPGKIVNSEGNESLDPNPLAAVGTMHNEALDYLTPDLNLNLFELPKLAGQGDDKVVRKKPGAARQGDDMRVRKKPGAARQGDDKVVRKKPGRTTYANISLEPAASLDTKSLLQHTSLFFMQVYDLAPTKALASEELASEVCLCAQDGYGYFENFQKQLSTKGPIKGAFQKLEETIMLSPDLNSFNRSIDQQVLEITKSQAYTAEERIMILGSLSLAKGTVTYWNAQNDIFEGDVIERGNGKFWADLGGFIAGAGAELLADEVNYGDVILTGLEAGAAASAIYEAL
tara:strand:- start:292 stop:2025 length:1734 start_codon:yes stop_codon:yes gene_type:complete